MALLSTLSITESQFAHIVGRATIYQYLPAEQKMALPPLLFGDNQISAACKDCYRDISFCRDGDCNINLWRLYNLFTGANKSSYIDTFLQREVNAYQFIEQIRHGIEGKVANWYLD